MTIFASLFGLACLGFFLLAFGGVGAFLIYRSWQQNRQADDSKYWPAAGGTITEAKVGESWSEDSDGHRQRSYHADVKYTYTVAGRVYSGDQIAFGFKQADRSPDKAQAWASANPPGKSVPVFYNPANPAESVLERRAGGLGITFVMGIVFLGVAVCMALPMLWVLVSRLILVPASQ